MIDDKIDLSYFIGSPNNRLKQYMIFYFSYSDHQTNCWNSQVTGCFDRDNITWFTSLSFLWKTPQGYKINWLTFDFSYEIGGVFVLNLIDRVTRRAQNQRKVAHIFWGWISKPYIDRWLEINFTVSKWFYYHSPKCPSISEVKLETLK